MITPISSVPPSDVRQSSPPPAPKPDPQTPKSGEVSADQVTLKSAGQVDHDGDSR
jgi:hypothetical protein